MATHAKTYREVSCPDCGKTEAIRTDSKRKRCGSCAKEGNKNPSKQKISTRSFVGTLEEYKHFHYKVAKKRGKARSCVNGCKASRYHWANLGGEYDDVWDYVSLCVSCHARYDFGEDILP